tara:strand:- start:699 stop:995 length:297 start_codon:yes stop_codon:yes gene_type:complete
MADNINPEHYKAGGIETIEYLKAKLSNAEYYGYLKGNAMKYISREGLKSDRLLDKIEDCRKAQWYIEEMVKVHQTEIAVMEAKIKEDEWIEDSLHDED